MHPFHRLLIWVMNYFGRYRIILDKGSGKPYLERFYIFLKDREKFPFNIFLHRFIRSDSDDLHDHPWDFRTLILIGGYWEHTLDGKFWRGPGSYRYVAANTYHRVELDENRHYCWTLFMPSKSLYLLDALLAALLMLLCLNIRLAHADVCGA